MKENGRNVVNECDGWKKEEEGSSTGHVGNMYHPALGGWPSRVTIDLTRANSAGDFINLALQLRAGDVDAISVVVTSYAS